MTVAATGSAHECGITLDKTPEGALITVSGTLDWNSVGEFLKDVGLAGGEPRLIVDLGSTHRVDSAGTGALITTVLRERRAHLQVAIVAAGEVAEVLDAVGVSEVVPVFATRQAAEAWTSESSQ